MNPKELLVAGIEFAANVTLAGIAGALVYGVISMSRKPQRQAVRKTHWALQAPSSPMLSVLQGPPFYFSKGALDAYGQN